MFFVTPAGNDNKLLNVRNLLHRSGRTTTMVEHTVKCVLKDIENKVPSHYILVFMSEDDCRIVQQLFQSRILSEESLMTSDLKLEFITLQEALSRGIVNFECDPICGGNVFIDHLALEHHFRPILDHLHRWDQRLILSGF